MTHSLFTKTVGAGPTLIMLHGWGMSSRIFHSFAEVLSPYFEVVLVDLPGFGKSPLLSENDYQFDLIIERLSYLTEKPAYWLGWSLGGLLATGVAYRFPEKTAGLIHIASTPCFLEKEDWPGVPEKVFNQFYKNLKNDYEKTLQHFITLQLFQCENGKFLLNQIRKILENDKHPSECALKKSFYLLKQMDLRSALLKLQCSQFAIYGRLDAIVPAQVESKIKIVLPQIKTLMLPHASHIPFISHPKDCRDFFLNYVL